MVVSEIINLLGLTTEQENTSSGELDLLSVNEIISLMNEEDRKVFVAVKKALPNIEKAVNLILQAFKSGGRLFYVGAGTSGRLGVIDAAECPPTFYTDPELVQGIMAGGPNAMFTAVEGAEDDVQAGRKDLQDRLLTKDDVVVGIAASGRTPYVKGALHYAGEMQAGTIALSCNENAEISQIASVAIEAVVGPEILTGSTRLKAATAQKMILNMLSTAVMVKSGKVFGNLMVDLKPSNQKLVERAKNIIQKAAGVTKEEAGQYLELSGNRVKIAIMMAKTKSDASTAEYYITQGEGSIRQAVLDFNGCKES